MPTENGGELDVDALEQVLHQGDVITIGFTLFPERLLIDTRARDGEGPLVAIVAPVATVQERFLWLGRHRGQFGAPKNFSFFVWPHSVRSMIERDSLHSLRRRLAAVSNDSDAALDNALQRLHEAEQRSIAEAIVGTGAWKTIWERSGTWR